MNSLSLRTLRGQLLREVITLLLFAGLTLQTMQAAAPGWWAARGVLTPGAPQDDYSIANLGQLKNIASKAAQELDENLLTGAGDDIHALLDDWNTAPLGGTTRDDYAALTLGQLKKVAKLFYDRLADVYVCPAGIYPWSGSNAADDYAVANVGQLKAVFAFDTSPADVNDNGIPDLWETTMFGSLDQDMDADFDGDGLSNREEWAAGTSADSEDSDGDDFSDKVELDHGYDPASRAIYPGQVSYQLADLSYRMEHVVVQYPDNTAGQHEWHVNKYIDMPDNVDYDFDVVMGDKPPFPPLPPVPTHADFEFPYWNSFYNGSVCRIYKLHTQSEFDEHRVIGGTLARVRAVSECASLRARTCYLLLETSSRAINTNDAPELEESSVATVTIPAQTTQSNIYEATLEPMEGRERRITATPFFCEIVPDESMYDDPLLAVGLAPPLFLSMAVSGITAFNSKVRGDLIESVLPGGDKHFVTPKKTAEINWDYVTLRASGATENDLGPNGKLEWHFVNPDDAQDTNFAQVESVPDEPPRLNVLRDKPRHVIASIGPKGRLPANDKIKMHVWVVWTTCKATKGVATYYQADVNLHMVGPNDPSMYGVYEVDTSNAKSNPNELWKFTFEIQPKKIITGGPDIPKLDGIREKPVPGATKPYTIAPLLANRKPQYGDSADLKWDVSRQYKITIRNPGKKISKGDLAVGIPSAWTKNQPTDVYTPVILPSGKFSDVEGNDDPPSIDEDDNPYSANQTDTLSHVEGELTSIDGPRLVAPKIWGLTARSYSCEMKFIEFARLELWDGVRQKGRFWFRISDDLSGSNTDVQWHHYLDATYDATQLKWLDNQSSSGQGHPKP